VTAAATTTGVGPDDVTTVTITNASTTPTVGFFLRTDLRRGTAAGTALPGDNEVRPLAWSGNDTTLWPGQSETVTATYATAALQGAVPVVSLSGWNVAPQVLVAPAAS
jgi:exo-1,4-beta-D-glucosaminidase